MQAAYLVAAALVFFALGGGEVIEESMAKARAEKRAMILSGEERP